jgi:hypothetical protein
MQVSVSKKEIRQIDMVIVTEVRLGVICVKTGLSEIILNYVDLCSLFKCFSRLG